MASAGLLEQLCSAAGRGTRCAQPGQGPETCAPQPWRPGQRLAGRTEADARVRPPPAVAAQGLRGWGGEGGCSRPVVTEGAIVVK